MKWTAAMLRGFGRRPFAGARGWTRGRRPKASVDDPRRRKRMALEDRVEAGPVERASSAMPSRQPFPVTARFSGKGEHSAAANFACVAPNE